jgi:hypothetical protein
MPRMGRYTVAYSPDVAEGLVRLPPNAERLGRKTLLELAQHAERFGKGPVVHHVRWRVMRWWFEFSLDHDAGTVRLENVAPLEEEVATIH